MNTPARNLSRRQFLRISATAGALLAGGIGLVGTRRAEAQAVRTTRLLMGSIGNLTVISDDPRHAQAAIDAAFERMTGLEAVFSRFQPSSQLSQLNRDGSLPAAHPALVDVLRQAVAYGQLTEGAFDVTIEAVHRLYREHARLGSLPDDESVLSERARVDYRAITIGEDSVRFHKPGMAITLDGIGKGYIIDQGAAVLRDYGYGNVLVELGGDMSALGQEDARPWQISIQQPPGIPPAQPLVATLMGCALATSGGYLNSFTPDHRLHHILDPLSGISPLELASASVIAPSACDADALATAVLVMGRERGLALAEGLSGVEALVMTQSGDVWQTAGFPTSHA